MGPEDASCTLAAHQSVLAARSPVLAAMFRHRFQEGETAKVRLVDVDFQCFKAYLHLLYTGHLSACIQHHSAMCRVIRVAPLKISRVLHPARPLFYRKAGPDPPRVLA